MSTTFDTFETIYIPSIMQGEITKATEAGVDLRDPKVGKDDATLAASLDRIQLLTVEKDCKLLKVLNRKVGVHTKNYGVINVCFSNSSGVASREKIYSEGFDAILPPADKNDTKPITFHYVEYKRSANQAKVGHHLFIYEKLLDDMRRWNWLGYDFNELFPQGTSCDLTSVKAYECLTSSGLRKTSEGRIATISIDPKSILVIDDIVSQEHGKMNVLKKNEHDEIYGYDSVDNGTYSNKLFDGQCLLDSSVFETGCDGHKHGMMLLRNHFFKGAAFNTDIKAYYRDHFQDDYDTAEVTDCYGNTMKARDVRMIITPDNVKWLKFFSKEEHAKRYYEWRDRISDTFGICKFEPSTEGRRKKYVPATYQILNSLGLFSPLNSDSDFDDIIGEEVDYMLKIYESDPIMMLHKIANDDHDVQMMLYHCVDGFEKTDRFQKWRENAITNYRKQLYAGKILLHGAYYTFCSNPYRMLKYSVMGQSGYKLEEEGEDEYLQPHTVYIEGSGEDGEQAAMFRSPHLSPFAGVRIQVMHLNPMHRNPMHRNPWKYFHFAQDNGLSRVVVVDPKGWDIMTLLGGADFDSDEVLIANNPMVVNMLSPEKYDNVAVHVPEEMKKGGADPYRMLPKDMAEMDDRIQKNQIGSISNLIQLLTSIMSHNMHEQSEIIKRTGEYPEHIFMLEEWILSLAALNELEIDNAKHRSGIKIHEIISQYSRILYNSTDIKNSLSAVETYIDDNGTKHYKAPYFMKCVPSFRDGVAGSKSKIKSRHKYYLDEEKYWQNTMDLLIRKIHEGYHERLSGIKRKNGYYDKKLDELILSRIIKDPKGNINYDQVRYFFDVAFDDYFKRQSINRRYDFKNSPEKREELNALSDLTRMQMEKKKINDNTAANILKAIFETYSIAGKNEHGECESGQVKSKFIQDKIADAIIAGREAHNNFDRNVPMSKIDGKYQKIKWKMLTYFYMLKDKNGDRMLERILDLDYDIEREMLVPAKEGEPYDLILWSRAYRIEKITGRQWLLDARKDESWDKLIYELYLPDMEPELEEDTESELD